MKMSSHGITAQNLLRTLPDALREDENMLALASSIANKLAVRPAEINSLSVYAQIDSQPEEMLDILAHDFKVDWYGYNYSLLAKRSLLKSSWLVHKRLGTRGAVVTALSDIYPGSEVQAWFDYGGSPYYFRVLLDVTNQRVAITHAEIIRAIDMYKSLRSHLQDNAIIYRSRIKMALGLICGYAVYTTRFCGTFPARATQGGITKEDIPVETSYGGASYSVPKSGTLETGRYPSTATQGSVESSGVEINADGNAAAYSVRLCGSLLGGVI